MAKKLQTLKSVGIKKMPVNKPGLPAPSVNAMGKSGTTLSNVDVRPTRMQTALHDIQYPVKTVIKESIKEPLKSKNILKKSASLVGVAGSIAGAAGLAGVSLFNAASGQARYNKNKRAGYERADLLENNKKVSRDIPLPSSDSLFE